jgi:hypothetical protein
MEHGWRTDDAVWCPDWPGWIVARVIATYKNKPDCRAEYVDVIVEGGDVDELFLMRIVLGSTLRPRNPAEDGADRPQEGP